MWQWTSETNTPNDKVDLRKKCHLQNCPSDFGDHSICLPHYFLPEVRTYISCDFFHVIPPPPKNPSSWPFNKNSKFPSFAKFGPSASYVTQRPPMSCAIRWSGLSMFPYLLTCWNLWPKPENWPSLEEEIDIEFFQNHQFSDFSCWFLGQCFRTVPLWFLVVVFLFGLHQGYFKPSPASISYMILWMIQPLLLCLSEAVKLHKKTKDLTSGVFHWCELLQFQPVVALDIIHLKRNIIVRWYQSPLGPSSSCTVYECHMLPSLEHDRIDGDLVRLLNGGKWIALDIRFLATNIDLSCFCQCCLCWSKVKWWIPQSIGFPKSELMSLRASWIHTILMRARDPDGKRFILICHTDGTIFTLMLPFSDCIKICPNQSMWRCGARLPFLPNSRHVFCAQKTGIAAKQRTYLALVTIQIHTLSAMPGFKFIACSQKGNSGSHNWKFIVHTSSQTQSGKSHPGVGVDYHGIWRSWFRIMIESCLQFTISLQKTLGNNLSSLVQNCKTFGDTLYIDQLSVPLAAFTPNLVMFMIQAYSLYIPGCTNAAVLHSLCQEFSSASRSIVDPCSFLCFQLSCAIISFCHGLMLWSKFSGKPWKMQKIYFVKSEWKKIVKK